MMKINGNTSFGVSMGYQAHQDYQETIRFMEGNTALETQETAKIIPFPSFEPQDSDLDLYYPEEFDLDVELSQTPRIMKSDKVETLMNEDLRFCTECGAQVHLGLDNGIYFKADGIYEDVLCADCARMFEGIDYPLSPLQIAQEILFFGTDLRPIEVLGGVA